ncbi:unnamed protein product [Lactuca virosa]|uniref:CCHC-type domain-containing protein n=1 Tax=Lactuca virosa TaxID=75947 RepID=A0AAU9LHH1_9ASTR|nr:unnamed protein product [Lactuca virosa]
MKIDGECPIELIGSCRNKVQVYRSVRMPQLHTSLHFHLTPIVMINGSSCRDLLLNSQNFCRSIPAGAENQSMSRLCYRRLWGSRNRRALILGWAYYLDAFSSYPLRTWLPSVYRGHDNWYTRGLLKHATEASECYTNDIQRLYIVVNNIQNLKQEGSMESYLGHVRALMQEFEALMPFVDSRATQTAQREKFFMVAALSGLKPEFESARHQILTGSTIPTMKDTFRRLLNMTGTNNTTQGPTSTPSAFLANLSSTSAPSLLAAGAKKGGNNKRPTCQFCGRLGHIEDKCWKKHGRPAAPPTQPNQSTSGSIHAIALTQIVNMSTSDYEAFQRYKAAQQSIHTVIGSSGTHSAFVTQGKSMGPWIVDSGATDHLCGNKHLFSKLTCSDSLPPIMVADGNKTSVNGVGSAQPISSLSLDSVLYVPKSPFNLVSVSRTTKKHSCSITFTPDSVFIQDLSTGRMIGKGHESQGHYYLGGSRASIAATAMSPQYLHHIYGHHSLSKLKRIVPSLASLESLECRDKLASKAVKCVFPGYSQLQKGYKCYSPSLNKYFMNADVTFFDHQLYYFTDPHDKSSVQQVLPIPVFLIPSTDHTSSPVVDTPTLKTYNRRPRPPIHPSTNTDGEIDPPNTGTFDSSSSSVSPLAPVLGDDDLPIAQRKDLGFRVSKSRQGSVVFNDIDMGFHGVKESWWCLVTASAAGGCGEGCSLMVRWPCLAGGALGGSLIVVLAEDGGDDRGNLLVFVESVVKDFRKIDSRTSDILEVEE